MNNKTIVLKIVSTCFRFGLAILWLVSGLLKLVDPVGTSKSILNYRLVHKGFADIAAIGLPTVEVVLGVLFLLGINIRITALLSILLLTFFIIIIISAWVRHLEINCGCFGNSLRFNSSRDYGIDIVRDIFFIGMASWLIVFPRSYLSF